MTTTEVAERLGKTASTVCTMIAEGRLKAGRAPHTNKTGRTMLVYDVSEEALQAYLAEVDQASGKKAQAKAERLRQKELARCERQRAREEREKALKKERTGAAAVIVRQCGVKSVKQLAQELGISTARVMEIYEAEGCL